MSRDWAVEDMLVGLGHKTAPQGHVTSSSGSGRRKKFPSVLCIRKLVPRKGEQALPILDYPRHSTLTSVGMILDIVACLSTFRRSSPHFIPITFSSITH